MNTIIIGALSGIGRELAKVFSDNSYSVGVTSRRLELLSVVADTQISPNIRGDNEKNR